SLPSAQTDARSADQRRADALVDVFTRVLGDPALPEQHGQRPAINVTVRAHHRRPRPPYCRGQVGHLAAAGHR
ncbi:MAG TPA: DUF222 domain-containing protein, partial [Jatrophihabitantaceae bacterium]